MKRANLILSLMLITAMGGTAARAAANYWDIDGGIPGAGGATPTGTWDAATANWTADSAGSSAAAIWSAGDTAVFSAGIDASGTFTVTVSGTQTAAGVTVEEGALTLSGGGISVDVASGGNFDIGSGLTTIVSSVISGGANNQTVTKNGGGQVNFTGANTYAGVTTVNAGTILLGNATALGTTAGNTVVNSGGAVFVGATPIAEPIVLNGTGVGGAGALRSTGTRTWSGSITLGSDAAKLSADGGQLTITGAITDGGNNFNVTLAGNGNTRLNTGTFNIGTGIITKEGNGNIQTEAGITAGGVNLNGGGLVFRNIAGTLNSAASTITVGPGAGSIGNVTFIGAAASLNIGSTMVLNRAGLPVRVANGTTLTFSGPISGASGGLDVQGTGTGKLLLNTAATYGGETKVTSGTLQLGALGSIAASSGVNVAGGTFDVTLVSFTLGAAQTLKGSGTINGLVTVNGTLAPGASPGTLTFNSGLILNNTAQLAYELAGNNTTVGGGVNDLASITGDLTLDGTLNVTELGAGSFLSAVGGNTWRLFNYTGILTDNGLTLGTLPALADVSYSYVLDTGTAGQISLVVVPEPSTVCLLFGGLVLLGGRCLLRRQA